MGKRLGEGKYSKTSSRHLRIGIIGVIASGKSELSKLLNNYLKNSKRIEELFGINPYLADFYSYPEKFSFKSQSWFLKQKTLQLSKLKTEGIEIIDPSLEMDKLYARTQYLMGWMKKEEWKKYRLLYNRLINTKKLTHPDLYIITKAPHKVLLKRIKERIKKGGRNFEKWIIEKYPIYLTKLSESVDLWKKQNKKLNLMLIDTSKYDFSQKVQREKLLRKIEKKINRFV